MKKVIIEFTEAARAYVELNIYVGQFRHISW